MRRNRAQNVSLTARRARKVVGAVYLTGWGAHRTSQAFRSTVFVAGAKPRVEALAAVLPAIAVEELWRALADDLKAVGQLPHHRQRWSLVRRMAQLVWSKSKSKNYQQYLAD